MAQDAVNPLRVWNAVKQHLPLLSEAIIRMLEVARESMRDTAVINERNPPGGRSLTNPISTVKDTRIINSS